MSAVRKRGRSVKPGERVVYDACHAAMAAGTIYAWNIANKDGTWSVQTAPGVYALDGASMAQVAAYIGLARKPRTNVVELRARIVELEAALSAAGLAVPGVAA